MSAIKARLSVQWTVEDWQACYMWTFTSRAALPGTKAGQWWKRIYDRLTKRRLYAGYLSEPFRGFRAFEYHPDGHGVHIHVLTPDFHPIDRKGVLGGVLRLLWGLSPRIVGKVVQPCAPMLSYQSACCGRIGVTKKPLDEAAYIAKQIGDYITKDRWRRNDLDGTADAELLGFPKRTRKLAAFGLEKYHRQNSVKMDTPGL